MRRLNAVAVIQRRSSVELLVIFDYNIFMKSRSEIDRLFLSKLTYHHLLSW